MVYMIQSNKVSSYVLTTAKIAEHSSHALKDMNIMFFDKIVWYTGEHRGIRNFFLFNFVRAQLTFSFAWS